MEAPSGYLQVERPYPGELLYSVLARTLEHLGCESPKRGLDLLFGHRSIITTPDLPTYLPQLAWLFAQWGLSSRDVMTRMTTLPYYLAFRSPSAVSEAQRAMECGKPSLLLQAGAGVHRVRRPSALRYCPQCAAEDFAALGEPYWRCMHQLPAVWCCPNHAVPLMNSTVRMDGTARHALIPLARVMGGLGEEVCACGNLLFPHLAKIAQASARMLCGDGLPDAWLQTLRARAGSMGYLEYGGRARLESDFVSYYSPQLLSAIGAALIPGLDSHWLRMLLHPGQRVAPALYHLLVHQFFDSVVTRPAKEPTVKIRRRRRFGPELDASIRELHAMGLTNTAIARELRVEYVSVARRLNREPFCRETASDQTDVAQLATERDAWQALMRDHPGCGIGALRKLAPALHAQLYRKQKAWLAQNRPNAVRRVAQATRVDWRSRDERLVAQVALVAAGIRQHEPLRRVSVASLLHALKIRVLSERVLRNLPQTTAAIETHAESVSDFQARRIRWHAARLERVGCFSLSALQRAAGIRLLPGWVRQAYGAPHRVQPDRMPRSVE